MKLTFHGTLSSIAQGNPRHAHQSLLEVAYGGRQLLIDCGSDWLGQLPIADPVALLLDSRPSRSYRRAGLRRPVPDLMHMPPPWK